jgi:(S)-3,5-dihydroxyphenylglycine transaminase
MPTDAVVRHRPVALKRALRDPALDVMNFLNSIVLEYPDAVSFAPGRPRETLLHVDAHVKALADLMEDSARASPATVAALTRDLAQYGPTNGIINDVLAAHLERDERISVSPDSIMVTVGAQEALAVLVCGLFDAGDVLLVSDPSYIGITGLATLLGIRTVPVRASNEGLKAGDVEHAIAALPPGMRARAVYDIPDFNNPLGTSLSIDDRLALLEVCHRHGVLLFEDNAYGMFAYDHARRPTLKALDRYGTVVYIGTFSKTLFPGLRVGYLVADQAVSPTGERLAAALSRVKSLLTVNTSPITQAIVATALRRFDYSLEPIVAPQRAVYRSQRDAMLKALARVLSDPAEVVSWNRPAGGFFLAVTLSCEFNAAALRACAAEYGVIVVPMTFFCLADGRRNQVRLSFSYVSPELIAAGVARFARFLSDRRLGAFR